MDREILAYLLIGAVLVVMAIAVVRARLNSPERQHRRGRRREKEAWVAAMHAKEEEARS